MGRYRAQAEYVVWGTNGPRPLKGPVHHRPSSGSRCPTSNITSLASRLPSWRALERDGWAILDPFMGSGTVGIACGLQGLQYVGFEVEPAYYEIALNGLKGGERLRGNPLSAAGPTRCRARVASMMALASGTVCSI